MDANHRRQPGKIDEPTALDALHPDRWKQCCSCGKWRFVDEDTARLLRTESFFDRRDTDLDWGRWLRDAKKRYDHFATCHSSSGGGDDSAVHGDAGSHEQGTLDGACDDERVTSEEGSGESEDDGDAEMSHGVRAALDKEISRLGGAGQPDSAAVAAADASESRPSVQNIVHHLVGTSVGEGHKRLRFECGMLQSSDLVGGQVTWSDGRCEDEDDFQTLFKTSLELSELEADDSVLLFPCGDSTIFHTPADLDASVALSMRRTAFCAALSGEPWMRTTAKPPFPGITVALPSLGSKVIELKMRAVSNVLLGLP